jgi:hypothetical protein
MAAARACERWETAEPNNAEPLLVRARLLGDPWLVPEALRRDPEDPAALRAEIARVRSWVACAFHHAGEGVLSEDAGAVRAGLHDLRALCIRLGDDALTRVIEVEAERFEAVLDGLDAWTAAGARGPFAAFMQARGVELDEAATYYFRG